MALTGKVIICVHYWTDLYLAHDVPDERLTDAVAQAFKVSRDRVAMVHAGASHRSTPLSPEVFAIVERSDREAEPHDRFPVEVSIGLANSAPPFDELAILLAISRSLGLPYVSDVEGDGEDAWRLILPTGETRPVTVDDDDHFTLSAADEAVIDSMVKPASRIAS